MDKKQIFQAILKDCFWDYDLTPEDIEGIVKSGNERELMWRFGKIITESRDRLRALQIFKKDQLNWLFDNYVTST